MERMTKGEIEVMRILWTHGEMKPSEIQEHFHRPIKDPALRSYLAILVKKGHLARRRKGKAFYYQAKTRRASVLRRMMEEIASIFFSGSTEALVCNLIQRERLSEKDLLRLKKLAEEDAVETGDGGQKGGKPSRPRRTGE